jgi:hypothetical protein
LIAFIGISYFDQTMAAWYALLAMIPAAIAVRQKTEVKPVPLPVPSYESHLIAQLSEKSSELGFEQYR